LNPINEPVNEHAPQCGQLKVWRRGRKFSYGMRAADGVRGGGKTPRRSRCRAGQRQTAFLRREAVVVSQLLSSTVSTFPCEQSGAAFEASCVVSPNSTRMATHRAGRQYSGAGEDTLKNFYFCRKLLEFFLSHPMIPSRPKALNNICVFRTQRCFRTREYPILRQCLDGRKPLLKINRHMEAIGVGGYGGARTKRI
jgi:hypothetical protein